MTPWPSRSIIACFVLLSGCPADPAPPPAEESSTGPTDTTSTGPGPGTTPQPTTESSSSSSSSGADTTAGTSTTGPDDTTSSSTTGPDDTTSSSSSGDSTTGDSTTGDSTTGGSTTTGDPSTSESTTGTTGPDPCDAGDGPDFTVLNNGFSDYVIDGANDPPLIVVRGCSYTFNVIAAGHPFLIKTVQGTGAGNQYNDGVVGNGAQVGVISWDVAPDAPDALFYNCQFHAPMTGTITVIDPM